MQVSSDITLHTTQFTHGLRLPVDAARLDALTMAPWSDIADSCLADGLAWAAAQTSPISLENLPASGHNHRLKQQISGVSADAAAPASSEPGWTRTVTGRVDCTAWQRCTAARPTTPVTLLKRWRWRKKRKVAHGHGVVFFSKIIRGTQLTPKLRWSKQKLVHKMFTICVYFFPCERYYLYRKIIWSLSDMEESCTLTHRQLFTESKLTSFYEKT